MSVAVLSMFYVSCLSVTELEAKNTHANVIDLTVPFDFLFIQNEFNLSKVLNEGKNRKNRTV